MARREQQTFGTIELQSGGGEQTGQVMIDPVDVSGGNTTLKLTSTQAVEAIGTWNVSHKLIININGTEYYLPLDIVAAWTAPPAINDIACATSIEESVLTPIRLVAGGDIAATTSIGASTLGIPLHGMGTDAVSSLTTVEEITITPIRVFGEDDIVSAGSAIGSPALEVILGWTNEAIASGSSVGTCTLTPIRVLSVNSIASAGSLVRKHDGVIDLEVIRACYGGDIAATTSVGESTLHISLHDMGTDNVAATTSVGEPVLHVCTHGLATEDIVSGVPYVGYPQVTT